MPNAITPQALEDLDLPELNRRLSLNHAGSIQPNEARDACEVFVDDIGPCVLYCEVVEGRAMKFGTAGSLRDRQRLNRGTINKILACQDGRYHGTNKKILDASTYDKYKRQAPAVIRRGRRIELFAVSLASHASCLNPSKKANAQCSACKSVESALNKHYKTLEHGWATREN